MPSLRFSEDLLEYIAHGKYIGVMRNRFPGNAFDWDSVQCAVVCDLSYDIGTAISLVGADYG